MSKERELLKRIANYGDTISPHFIYEINELLAQPEQEPTTRHALDSYWNQEAYQRGYAEAELKLKRERITDEEIYNHCCAMDSSYTCNFIDGVEWAEKHHGIGVEDE